MHKTLTDWRARRAGGRITVYGECQDTHQQTKITRVDVIRPGKPGSNCVIATSSDGVEHHLLLS